LHIYFNVNQYTNMISLLRSLLLAISGFCLFVHPIQSQSLQHVNLVDPFWGVEGGNVFPGACLPFSMMRVGPDAEFPTPTSGYSSTKPIVGFSHTHLSGTGGGGRYGNILLTPTVGSLLLENRPSLARANEYAKPGYYSTTLQRKDGDVHAELTSTHKTALHKYQFYTWNKNQDSLIANVLIDVSHMISRNPKDNVVDGSITILSPTKAEGWGKFKGGWGGELPYQIFFSLLVDKPTFSSGTWTKFGAAIDSTSSSVSGKGVGGFFRFKLAQKEEVKVKVAISYLSTAQAETNLNQEMKDWDFEKVRNQAAAVWAERLGKIQVKGGSPELQSMFYSALYHTMIMPTDVTGENPKWESKEPHFWEHYCIWDVFRCLMPLHTLIYPEQQRRIIRGLLDIYKNKGWLPDAWVAGDYADIQGGTNADVVLADALVKNLGGFDKNLAFEAMLKNADGTSWNYKRVGRNAYYQKLGYCPENVVCGTSMTLEYSYNDFCMAQAAKILGKNNVAKSYLDKSLNYRKLFNPEVGFFWSKDSLGKWKENFTPKFTRPDHWNGPHFYEGNAYHYAAYAPHDMRGLINLYGQKQFEILLDSIFKYEKVDVGNEPSFLTPYAYHWLGRPDKSAGAVRGLLKKDFKPGRRGLPGQDDSGALSSWYIWGMLGLYPVAGQDFYLLCSPSFKEASLSLENGKAFTMQATNPSAANIYVQSATLNGQAFTKSWISHAEISRGGTLKLVMGSKPSAFGKNSFPPSLTN